MKQGAYIAMRFLHAYCARFDEIPAEDLTTAVDAIEDCVRASRLPEQTTTEPLYVTRLLTNCVSKAARMVCSDKFLHAITKTVCAIAYCLSVHPSVSPSVRSRCFIKMAKCIIA